MASSGEQREMGVADAPGWSDVYSAIVYSMKLHSAGRAARHWNGKGLQDDCINVEHIEGYVDWFKKRNKLEWRGVVIFVAAATIVPRAELKKSNPDLDGTCGRYFCTGDFFQPLLGVSSKQ